MAESEEQTRESGPRRGVRERVFAATLELLAEVPYGQLTMEAIAARAGASKATLYRWWPSKAAIVMDLLVERVDAPARPSTGTFRDDLRTVLTNVVQSLSNMAIGPAIGSVAFDVLSDPDLRVEFQRRFHTPRRKDTAALVLGGIERGELRDDIDAGVLLDTASGAMLYRLAISGGPLDEGFIDAVLDIVLAGAERR